MGATDPDTNRRPEVGVYCHSVGTSVHDIGARVERGGPVGDDAVDRVSVRGQMTLASFFSLASNSATVFTLMPAWRLGGSLTFRTFNFGVMSTP